MDTITIDYELARRMPQTVEERRAGIPVAAWLCGLAAVAYEEGLLQLEDHAEVAFAGDASWATPEFRAYAKSSISMILDGFMLDTAKEWHQRVLSTRLWEGEHLQVRLLLAHGFLAIQSRCGPRSMENALLPFIGFDLQTEFEAAIGAVRDAYRLACKATYAPLVATWFRTRRHEGVKVKIHDDVEALFSTLARRYIQTLLRQISADALASALLLCSKKTRRRVFAEMARNLQEYTTELMVYELRTRTPEEWAKNAQSILVKAQELAQCGEISLPGAEKRHIVP